MKLSHAAYENLLDKAQCIYNRDGHARFTVWLDRVVADIYGSDVATSIYYAIVSPQ